MEKIAPYVFNTIDNGHFPALTEATVIGAGVSVKHKGVGDKLSNAIVLEEGSTFGEILKRMNLTRQRVHSVVRDGTGNNIDIYTVD